ncbi:hypothetical protein evm_003890 [Chilo suppressalis]|nr:hypothetical protein evm_003890 [Chilo suppressalis]
MFKIESYVTPILLSYVDKYVRDFKPADAQVSLWGGGVALHNLVLKADVLQQEVSLPFTLVSGRIHELLIQVPWTKIMSEPIVITIDTIECVLNLNPPAPQDDNLPPEPPRRTQVVEAPPGYMQALVRRIVSNIALRVHHLIVKYVQDDIVLSLNVKHLAVDSAGPSWEPSFADIDPVEPVLRRLVRLDDLTLCLDRADSDGKIRFYQEPLLYRCQLDLRVLTRLVSANTRRATGLSVQLRSSKLAWGVTNDQLVLLLRLLNESPRAEAKPPPPAPKMAAQAMPMHTCQNSAEPARMESWSEWAWSWLPAWADREGAEETTAPPAPIPVALHAYLDDVALVLKMMEVEGGTRKRARALLEVSASHAAIKVTARAPTMMRARLGLRNITLAARGKCVCGHNASTQEPTVYLSKCEADSEENPWTWPEEDPTDARIELAQVADETLRDTATPTTFDHPTTSEHQEVEGQTELPSEYSEEEMDPLWQHMEPVLFVEYSHERSPPQPYTNPYENPPADFEYSDWVEVCSMRVQIRPLCGVVCPALVHRLSALYAALGDLPPTPVADLPTRTLTVEECDALMENLPQKRISIEMRELRVRLLPWDHAAMEKATEPLLSLDIDVPKVAFVITGPLYPHRVCSAACQMPEDSGPLWNGARLHISGSVSSAQAQLWAGPGAGNPRPCARVDVRCAIHLLLNKHMFSQRESVVLSYTVKLRELSVCGSSARIQAATQVVNSLINERLSTLLQHSTLAKDALNDEESVAIDLTAEELSLRGYLTANVNTHILSLQSARATAHHAPKEEEVKQAWLFSAPDTSTTTPYLRFAIQWCNSATVTSLEYFGLWTEPISFCADPLLIAWLAYKPTMRPYRESHVQLNTSGSQYGLRRRPTPPSSSGRAGSRAGSGAELVHVRPRSVGSSSEPSERRDQKQQTTPMKPEPKYWDGERVVHVHTRLRRALVNVELGLVLVYAAGSTASALDCATVHDAMERHARLYEPVLAASLGRVSVHSNTIKKHLWQEIRHDGPTFINTSTTTDNSEDDSFPWKLRLADVSCYTLGINVPTERSSRDFSVRTQRSQLKTPEAAHKTVLEMVTTTVTLSVVTKSLQIKPSMRRDRTDTANPEPEDKTKYFTTGIDFKPSTLKEFFRGPAKRKKSTATPTAETQTQETQPPGHAVRSGPLVSLGVHLHADTPPIIVRLDREQVHLVATAVHGLQHMLALLQRRPVLPQKTLYTSVGTSRRSLIRSVSEIEEVRTPSEETQSENPSENRSELISIYESYNAVKRLSQFSSNIINVFCRIANLPANWKEELHPKLLEEKTNTDTMWEIYATVAPLEAVLQPEVLKNIMSLAHEFAPRSFCPLQQEASERKMSNWQWPTCYVNAGGLRLLLTSEEEDRFGDDTFIFQISKLTVSPYPENPICRRPVNTTSDVSWLGSSGLLEGQQYEVLVHGVGIRSAQLQQLACQEVSENELLKGTGGENPALKWTQPVIAPVITPMLHNVDIGCVLAPAIYSSDLLVSGPAVEFNLVSDCCVDISLQQATLGASLLADLAYARPKEMSFEDGNCGACPFAPLLIHAGQVQTDTSQYIFTEVGEGTDSGVDTITSHSTLKTGSRVDETTSKKTLSVVFVDHSAVPSEYLEVFVTMGVIDVSLYTVDDNSPSVVALRPPAASAPAPASAPATANATSAAATATAAPAPASSTQVKVIFEEAEHKEEDVTSVGSRTKSLTDTMRSGTASKSKLRYGEHTDLQQYKKAEGCIPLLHVTLHQPNLYYWRRKTQKSLQVSLFNAWVGLGAGQTEGRWNIPLLTTSRGIADPVTDIPPALATLRLSAPAAGNTRGSIRLDVERPVQVEVCTERVRRLTGILALIQEGLLQAEQRPATPTKEHQQLPFLYKIRRFLVQHSAESVTVHTSQVSVCGSEGTLGCDGVSMQVAVGARPDRLYARALVHALLAAAGPPGDRRHPLVQPAAVGINMEASWEAWRRAEGGASPLQPTVQLCVDADQLCVELRPSELCALARLQEAFRDVMQQASALRSDADYDASNISSKPSFSSTRSSHRRSSNSDTELSDHYYKDDLRSGAFKLVGGGQLPMAYQVTLHAQTVAWRYPHPRAVTRVLAFPLPDQDDEFECILEFYNPVVGEWHAYAHFNIPVSGPAEVKLYITAPDAVFAQMWRMRPRPEKEPKQMPFEFDFARYLPRNDPMAFEQPPEPDIPLSPVAVTAEQLCGAVRVDSYFAPRALPRVTLCARAAGLQLHAHNALPLLPSQAKTLEGYYVSRPLMRSHRVLSLIVRDAGIHLCYGAPAGGKAALEASLAADIMDCATGTMEPLVDEFRLQLAASFPERDMSKSRWRGVATDVRAALHVPRLRTAAALVADWQEHVRQYLGHEQEPREEDDPSEQTTSKRLVAAVASRALEGRISMWIHNSCACALRVGQDGTDERVTLGPGARFAYRWRSPTAPKGLRIAFAGPVTDWIWSSSVPFASGTYRVRLESGEATHARAGSMTAHVTVQRDGARRTMRLAGHLELANLLRYNLLYKVRTRCQDSVQWQTVMSGELEPESVGRSVMCPADTEMALKIKFTTHDTGWSGDIPLKECPKENVPWLVKVPSEGDLPYISVWCRVVRARGDGRVLAAVWPLYVLYSHVPHDAAVMIETESTPSPTGESSKAERPAPLIQTAPGRGASTHLVAPGTTSARHNLTFQYRNIECPVTRDAVPLHYGVTDTSVFDKRAPVNNLEDVVQDILNWLDRSGRNAKSSWPYSLVTKHWPGTWQPALLQPRSDVNVRYEAVRAGGGCSLELRLCPAALVCNAAPIALTLRAHDATPLCKLEPGTALCPPSVMLQKPFFISVELGRDTFVSGQLALSAGEPGRYGAPPPGHLAPLHPAAFAIHCNNRVALLTMYYEIIHDINVLGASSTYEFINRLDTDVLVSAVAVPKDLDDELPLRPKMFKVVQPCKENSVHGVPLCRFWLGGRWRSGGDPSELAPFLCVALPSASGPEPPATVPVRLGQPPYRRALALTDENGQSLAVVVTQLRHEGRWLVTLARDPCPQFLVYNHTRESLALAQPRLLDVEPNNAVVQVTIISSI